MIINLQVAQAKQAHLAQVQLAASRASAPGYPSAYGAPQGPSYGPGPSYAPAAAQYGTYLRYQYGAIIHPHYLLLL